MDSTDPLRGIERGLDGVAAAFDAHTDVLAQQRDEYMADRAQRRLAVQLLGGVGLLLGIVVAIGFVVILSMREIANETKGLANETKAQSVQNEQLILRVNGCMPEDSPEVCADRQTRRDLAEGVARVEQVDCIHRRLHAGLPAPVPPGSCTSQTPPEIYPGLGSPVVPPQQGPG